MGSWSTDGAKGFSIKGKVVVLEPNGGMNNVYNAMWRDGNGVSSGRHYWKIHFPVLRSDVGKGSTAVGFTSEKHFGTGYACKSIIYSGDLNVGGLQDAERGRVVGDFGPKLKQGDTVGILAVFEDNRLKVYIDVSGTSLGLCFDVLASNFESIFPLVSFDYEGSATCTKESDIPTNITSRSPAVFPGIVGPWKLLEYDGEQFPSIVAPDCVFLSRRRDEYIWVVNKFRTNLANSNGIWKASNLIIPRGRSSKPQKLEKEQKIIDLMTAVNKVEIVDGHLSIRSDGIKSKWIRPKMKQFVGGNLFTAGVLPPSTISSSQSAASTSSGSK